MAVTRADGQHPVSLGSEVAVDAPRHRGEGTTIAGTAVLLLLAGMALLDRPFGLLGVPGVPIYVTEVVLAICVAWLLVRREPLEGFASSTWIAPLAVVGFMAWGTVRLLGSMGNPILEVARDYALAYYALFALIAYALSRADRRFRPDELLRIYGRFVPVMLIVAPIRLVFASVPSLQALPPIMPGSNVPLLGGHRPGNLGVQVALAVVYLAASGRRDRMTIAGIVLGMMTILLIGTQNRGGFIAAAAVIGIAILLWGRRLRFRWGASVAVLLAMLVVAWGLNLQFSSGTRSISVSQLVANAKSLVGDTPKGSSQLSDTEDFRSQLWTLVLNETVRTHRLENGWGFGMNLGASFLPAHGDQDLRNPHNSHLTVLVRLGIVGLGIWLVLFVSWFRRLFALAHRRRRAGARGSDDERPRLAMLCAAMVAGILVNAFVDPTLETPMAAVWLWFVVGTGIAVVLGTKGRASESPSLN
jgi:O-antigen ligase